MPYLTNSARVFSYTYIEKDRRLVKHSISKNRSHSTLRQSHSVRLPRCTSARHFIGGTNSEQIPFNYLN